MASFISRYFDWLQKDNPAEDVEKYPETNEHGETSAKGVYIIGDLTGIPLLKLAAESGKRIIDHLAEETDLPQLRARKAAGDILDVVIIGAGPAGVVAGHEAAKRKWDYVILESARPFNTIESFPKGKPIYSEPDEYEQEADLKITDGTKETLLEDLEAFAALCDLDIRQGVTVRGIEKGKEYFTAEAEGASYKALKVIIAMGKSGNARMPGVPGEDKPKVYTRLFDPADAEGEHVLVVGGGDSALEAAAATAGHAESVTLSYRRGEFSRPKEGNIRKIETLAEQGKVKLKLETEVAEIKDDSVVLQDKDGKTEELHNSMALMLIGKELPTEFFRRSGITMEGDMSLKTKLYFLLLILVSGVIYFGKSSAGWYEHFLGDGKLDSWGAMFSQLGSPEFWAKFVTLPAVILTTLFSEDTRIWHVTSYINAFVAYISFIGAVALGVYLLYDFLKGYWKQIAPDWKTFKYAYFIAVGVFFVVVFFGGRYFGVEALGKSQGFWYTGLYSLTILVFGLRRMHKKPTKYIRLQTWALILIQALPLFILPEFVFPFLGEIGALGVKDGLFMSQVFPGESYWRSYGFILAWPLNFSNLYSGNITTFWLVFSIFQTFVFIPAIIYYWGKGAYCGWICSCGALAETLGDEYRTKAPHGPKAKRLENMGQVILFFAFIITGAKLLSILFSIEIPLINESIGYTADVFQKAYYISIDVIFAGVLGVGVYFFMSGRIWCRYGCPLAALMHIYTRFTRYRIFAEKKKCISCNICTKVCHMGIDVMNYANKGIPMNDVECVRCSACVVNCPTEALTFGALPKTDANNTLYKTREITTIPADDWRSGLR